MVANLRQAGASAEAQCSAGCQDKRKTAEKTPPRSMQTREEKSRSDADSGKSQRFYTQIWEAE
uniref:Uncharacterized protein n=1 Tax=Pristionchus pacificus TaxID=54126 RepID=A0A2A6B997_PRIPA|eukprot:PDM62462.1 hypothetical protein PRIPAC_51904 [Pristionchus pacificus]